MPSIAEKVKNLIDPRMASHVDPNERLLAYSLASGYGMTYGSETVHFPSAISLQKRLRKTDGRVMWELLQYADDSKLLYTYSEHKGPHLAVVTEEANHGR